MTHILVGREPIDEAGEKNETDEGLPACSRCNAKVLVRVFFL